MPHWLIYHPKGAFDTVAEKQALSRDICTLYTAVGLPAFYVVVHFLRIANEDTWVGGEQRDDRPFIRISVAHIAINLPNEDEAYHRVTNTIDDLLKPHIEDKGYDWEYHIDETDRRLWKINGLIPPPWKSDEEKKWSEMGRPSEYPGARITLPPSTKAASSAE